MNHQNAKNTDYSRLRNLVRKQGYQLRRLRTKLAREWNAGYYIVDPNTGFLVAGHTNLGFGPNEVEQWCKAE